MRSLHYLNGGTLLHFQLNRNTAREMALRTWFVGDWLGGNEIGVKTGGVRIEQLLNAFGTLGFQNKAGVVILRDAIRDFRIAVGGSVRMLLARQRKNGSGIVATNGWKLVGLIPCPDFKPRPLAPEIDARCGLDDIRDISPANTSGDFYEIEFAVSE